MGEIVNLKRFKKRQARADAAKEADANRAAHGRTRAERAIEDARRSKARADLDGHRREDQ